MAKHFSCIDTVDDWFLTHTYYERPQNFWCGKLMHLIRYHVRVYIVNTYAVWSDVCHQRFPYIIQGGLKKSDISLEYMCIGYVGISTYQNTYIIASQSAIVIL